MKSKKQSTINPILLTFAVCFLLLFNQMSVRAATKKILDGRTLCVPFTIITFFIYLFPLSLFIYILAFLPAVIRRIPSALSILNAIYRTRRFPRTVDGRTNTEFIRNGVYNLLYWTSLYVNWIPWAKRRVIDLYRTKRKDKLLLFFSHSLTFQRHWCFLFPGTAWNCQKILLVDCYRPWIEWLSRSRLASSKPVLYLRFTKLLYEKTGRAKRLAKLENLVAIQQRRKYCSPFISAIQ